MSSGVKVTCALSQGPAAFTDINIKDPAHVAVPLSGSACVPNLDRAARASNDAHLQRWKSSERCVMRAGVFICDSCLVPLWQPLRSPSKTRDAYYVCAAASSGRVFVCYSPPKMHYWGNVNWGGILKDAFNWCQTTCERTRTMPFSAQHMTIAYAFFWCAAIQSSFHSTEQHLVPYRE